MEASLVCATSYAVQEKIFLVKKKSDLTREGSEHEKVVTSNNQRGIISHVDHQSPYTEGWRMSEFQVINLPTELNNPHMPK